MDTLKLLIVTDSTSEGTDTLYALKRYSFQMEEWDLTKRHLLT